MRRRISSVPTWKSFRENFKQATAIWLILLAVLIVLILDLLLVMRMPGTITYLRLFSWY